MTNHTDDLPSVCPLRLWTKAIYKLNSCFLPLRKITSLHLASGGSCVSKETSRVRAQFPNPRGGRLARTLHPDHQHKSWLSGQWFDFTLFPWNESPGHDSLGDDALADSPLFYCCDRVSGTSHLRTEGSRVQSITLGTPQGRARGSWPHTASTVRSWRETSRWAQFPVSLLWSSGPQAVQ